MFKFLFGSLLPRFVYDVYYTLGEGNWVLKTQIRANSEYDANRRFDQESPACYHRVANATRLAR